MAKYSSLSTDIAAAAYKPTLEYPKSGLGRNLRTIAGLVVGGLSTRIYFTFHGGGFDTHANQRPQHDNLMKELNEKDGSLLVEVKLSEKPNWEWIECFRNLNLKEHSLCHPKTVSVNDDTIQARCKRDGIKQLIEVMDGYIEQANISHGEKLQKARDEKKTIQDSDDARKRTIEEINREIKDY